MFWNATINLYIQDSVFFDKSQVEKWAFYLANLPISTVKRGSDGILCGRSGIISPPAYAGVEVLRGDIINFPIFKKEIAPLPLSPLCHWLCHHPDSIKC